MLSDDIKQFFKGDVEADEKTLDEYSHDYSIFKVRPQVVVFPKDVEDIKNLVKFANEHEGVSLTARSAGTDMTGGPLNESVIVEFSRYFNHIKEIGEDYAIVEPGVYFRDFEKELIPKGLLYPAYPASKDLCALGGMISNNSGGEKTLAYGKTEKYVMELRMVMSDGNEYTWKALKGEELQEKLKQQNFEGEVYRKIQELIEKNREALKAAKPDVSKNSSGYYLWNVEHDGLFDIPKLLVGSQGTLGIVVEAKLKLLKKKKYSRLAVVFLKSLCPVADLVVDTLKFNPESLESYDDKTLLLSFRFLPGIIKAMKGSFLKLIWQFIPEAFMFLRGGMPKMVVLIELTSDDEIDLAARLKALHDEVAQKFHVPIRILKNEAEGEKYWTIRRQSFKLLHDHNPNKATAPFIDDVVVKPEYLPEFLPKLNAILEPYKNMMTYTIAGQSGDGNFHIIPIR